MLDAHELRAIVATALREDIGSGDATTEATVPADLRAEAHILSRAPGVLAGRPAAEEVFRQLSRDCRIDGVEDGAALLDGQVALNVHGPAPALLSGERVALNFLQRLSGIATLTASYVREVEGTGVAITDTRKTTPTLRRLEKYAVLCGGGVNHRGSLDAMLLVKENHIAAAGSLERAVRAAMRAARGRQVEVEVRSLQELEEVLRLGASRILLDHWTPEAVGEAVRLCGDAARPELEVSGNLTLENVRAYAVPGVRYLSVGALTHSAAALDLSMLLSGVRT